MRLLIKIAIISLFHLVTLNFAGASPWATVGDSSLRNDVEVLAYYGLVSGPVNTWPMTWKQITANLHKADSMNLPLYVRHALARVRAKIPAEINGSVTAAYTNNPETIRGFNKSARNEVDIQGSVDFNLDSGTTIHVQGGYRSGNMEDYAHFDGSYVSQDMGNWALYAGAVDRWWGPGRESTLILSNNARPMPSIGLRRIEPKAFETKWLSWMGPWNFEVFVSQMDEKRHIPEPIFVGIRTNFEPVDNFEVGLSRTLMLCGRDRPCGLKQWAHGLIAVGDLDNFGDSSEDVQNQPGNQLAQLDLSYSFSLNENSKMKIYAEGAAEDVVVVAPYTYTRLIGASFFGRLGDSGNQYRITTEYSDSTGSLVWFFGEHRKGVMYNHFIYLDGYRYLNKVIGMSLDSNSRYVSLEGVLTLENGFEVSARYQNILINSENNNNNRVSLSRERINNLTIGGSKLLNFGKLSIEGSIRDNEINTPKEDKVNVRVEFSLVADF